MTKSEGHKTGLLAFPRALHKRREHARSGAPRQMKARHRIAMAARVAAAALGPTDDGKEADTTLAQPRAFLAGGEVDISLRPWPRPKILLAIECGRPEPVRKRQRPRIANAETALFGGVDQKQAAERPEGLPAKRLLSLLIDNNDFLPRVDEFGGGDKAGDACADNNHVRIVGHVLPLARSIPSMASAVLNWRSFTAGLTAFALPTEHAATAVLRR